ncbi:membrane-spanning 4-domains subfamily A member 4A-like [Silurus meridionalis]|uniref:Membrane-spanning 4-domains subfamily A member 4A-like n=1 Tax=Silurus meridionalis TaxID=175797 RepID=A0A8T0BJG6_SILME|nr:membrane-spanning 4-domains subfamily A member 4A-like [Silurus meridionalis]KAF7706273.1 hypothetical protein HF521_019527 [Silurus meridionalis]
MADGDMESIVPNVQNIGSETGALVEVKFQKTPYQTQKYLEGEPKALGVTQIMLTIFFINVICLNWRNHHSSETIIISIVFSLVSIAAGSAAIKAQNLHLTALKACLGFQVLACVFSVICFIISSTLLVEPYIVHFCWFDFNNENSTLARNMCNRMGHIYSHISGIEMLVQVAQIALSATLAAYCCKIIQCCSPRSNVPVIAVNVPSTEPQPI